MSNPTTNKPATPVFSNSLGFGATAYAAVAFAETAGAPVESKTGTLGRYYDGYAGYGTGPAPTIQATGFPWTPAAGPSLRFNYGSPTLLFPSAGFPSSGLPVKRVYACVFRFDFKHTGVSGNMGPWYVLGTGTWGGSNPGNGICIPTLASNNTYNLGWYRSFGNTAGAAVNFNLVVGQWYAVALSIDQTASPFTRQLQVYDYTAQVQLTTQSTTETTAMTENAVSDLLLNQHISTANEYYPFVGQYAAVLLDTGSVWTDPTFLTFAQDPWATVRGTYSAAGTFTAGQFDLHHAENSVVALSGARATGTGTGGTGSPTYFLQRTTDLSAAPATGNRIATLTMNTSGNLNYTDNTAQLGTVYGYRIEAVDGSSTVYYPASTLRPVLGRARAGTNVGIGFCGDSRTQSYLQPFNAARYLLEIGDCKVSWMNRGKSGLRVGSWSNGSTSQWTVSITGGPPTSGGFGISVQQDGGGLVNATGIQWNETAAQLQTALQALSNVGNGNVTCTGGPFPSNPITVSFTTNHAYVLSLQTASNGLNNGAAPAFTQVYAGNAPDPGTWLQPAITEAVAAGLGYMLIEIGTNDENASPPMAPADYGRALASGVALMVANGLKVFLAAPPICRTSTMTPTQAEYGRQYAAQMQALADNVNVFYIGQRIIDYTDDNFYGSADGLHGMSGEYQAEGHYWGKGMLDVFQPSGGGYRPRSLRGLRGL